MKKRKLGKTGMEVTVLGYGGSEIGYQGADPGTVKRLLDAALDAGLNVIDTAACYKASEEMIGAAVSRRRAEYFLFTKTGHAPDGDHWNPKKMAEGIVHSLRMLRTDAVDLLQLHSCSEEQLRAGDVIEVLQRARESGQTRFIGYSGDGAAARYAVDSGIFDTLQTSVNIADQEAIDLTLPLAQSREMGVIAKRPIANVAWKTGAKPKDSYHHTYWERLRELQYQFLGGDVNQAVSIALRFTLAAPGVDTAIVGTQNPDRWQSNAKLVEEGPLDPTVYEQIRAAWKQRSHPDWVGQT